MSSGELATRIRRLVSPVSFWAAKRLLSLIHFKPRTDDVADLGDGGAVPPVVLVIAGVTVPAAIRVVGGTLVGLPLPRTEDGVVLMLLIASSPVGVEFVRGSELPSRPVVTNSLPFRNRDEPLIALSVSPPLLPASTGLPDNEEIEASLARSETSIKSSLEARISSEAADASSFRSMSK